MTTDLRYAMGQLKPVRDDRGQMSRPEIVDRVQRAMDALERALERAEAIEANDEPVAVVQSFGGAS